MSKEKLKQAFFKAVSEEMPYFYYNGKKRTTEYFSLRNPKWTKEAVKKYKKLPVKKPEKSLHDEGKYKVRLADSEKKKSDYSRTKFQYDPEHNKVDRFLSRIAKLLKKDIKITGGDRSDKFVAKSKGVGLSNHRGQMARDLGFGANQFTDKEKKIIAKEAVLAGLRLGGDNDHIHLDAMDKPTKVFRESGWDNPFTSDYINIAEDTLEDNKDLIAAQKIKDPERILPELGDSGFEFDEGTSVGDLRRYDEKLSKKDKKDVKKIEKLSKALKKAEKDEEKNEKKIAKLSESVEKIPQKESFNQAFERNYQERGPGGTFKWRGNEYLLKKAEDEVKPAPEVDFKKQALIKQLTQPAPEQVLPEPPPVEPEMGDAGHFDPMTGRHYLRGPNPADMEPQFADGGTAFSKISQLLGVKPFRRDLRD